MLRKVAEKTYKDSFNHIKSPLIYIQKAQIQFVFFSDFLPFFVTLTDFEPDSEE